MKLRRLLARNLLYHWRGNLAVMLGVAVGTAVLTGALFVGDSLRGSLRALTLDQLGWVEHALVSGRFIRDELCGRLGAAHASPVILLQGATTREEVASGGRKTIRRAGKVSILGVDEQFWPVDRLPVDRDFWGSSREEVVLNQALADELGVAELDQITLSLQKVSDIPRESLLGRRDAGDVLTEIQVRVRAVIPNQGMGRFSLRPTPATPRNVYVPLRFLQARLHQVGRVNAILAAGSGPELNQALAPQLTLDDWGLIVRDPSNRSDELYARLDRRGARPAPTRPRQRVAESFIRSADTDGDGLLAKDEILAFYRKHRSYLTLESRQLILEPFMVEAASLAARETRLRQAPLLVYLANTIAAGKNEIPYSVVAALEPEHLRLLAPGLFGTGDLLKNGEIVLVDWQDSPLQPRPGDDITLRYFPPEHRGKFIEQSATFRMRGLAPLQGAVNDPDITPEFPGITDKLDIRDWNPPFPYDNKRVGQKDERFWEQYRTVPKALVTLADGQRLWGSRFGDLTSIRLYPTPVNGAMPAALEVIRDEYEKKLLGRLEPGRGGLSFDAVRERALQGSSGSTDFGQLFLGFSFFLIAAALLLVALLVRLNMGRRAAELGLLLALGYRRRTVRMLLLVEGCVLAALGGLAGTLGAFFYAWLMLELLRVLWPGSLEQSILRLHVSVLSIAIGYVAAWLVSIFTIAWAVRILSQVSPRGLLAGQAGEETPVTQASRGFRRPQWTGIGALLLAVACLALGTLLKGHEARAGSFFSSGALLLTAGLTGLWVWMRRARHGPVTGSGTGALNRLAIRNAARSPVRSLLTAGLLAAATFLIVAVESFHRDAGKGFLDKKSGSGGFALVGEADVPLYMDFRTAAWQSEVNLDQQAKSTLEGVSLYPLRLREGDDASCLNLYQARKPRLLGVSNDFVQRSGFLFKEIEARNQEEQANPWTLLQRTPDDGSIPAFGEANTVIWMLHSGLGQTIEMPDERGEPVRLRIVGLLQDSVFQGELLVSEEQFLRAYPKEQGHTYFMIESSADRADSVRQVLETALADFGFVVTPAARKLEAYLAVENTYLATFQMLGGLGLVLGALGLAVVLLRSVWERRGELALFQALGFRKSALRWLVVGENAFLLLVGLGLGTLSALVAVAPHVIESGGRLPLGRLVGLLGIACVVGLASAVGAVFTTLQTPILTALRRE